MSVVEISHLSPVDAASDLTSGTWEKLKRCYFPLGWPANSVMSNLLILEMMNVRFLFREPYVLYFLNMSQVLWPHYLYSLPLHLWTAECSPQTMPATVFLFQRHFANIHPCTFSLHPSQTSSFFPFLYILSILQASPPIFITFYRILSAY